MMHASHVARKGSSDRG